MTVSSTISKVSYAGNGSTTTFTVSFYFLDNTHLKVIKKSSAGVETTLVLNTDYSVTGAGVSSGGSITCTTAPASGETLAIARNVPFTQEVDYQANDPFPAETHERALDKLTMEVQQVNSDIGAAIRFPVTDSSSISTILPSSELRANKYLRFDATGAPSIIDSQIATIYYGASATDPATRPDGSARVTGDLYFNTAVNNLRAYSGSGWVDTGVASPVSVNGQQFSGNGVLTNFTLSWLPASQNAVEVFISGVRQVNGVDFTVSTYTLTFTSAPPTGTNNIYVRILSTIAIGTPADDTVTTAKIVDGAVNGNKLAAGAAVANIGYTPANDTLAMHLAGAETATGAKRGAVVGLTDGATITPDFAAGNNFTVTLGGNRTLANPTNIVAGQSGVIAVNQDGTGSRTLSFGGYWKFAAGTAPTLTTTASAVDLIAYYVESATRIDARFIGDVK